MTEIIVCDIEANGLLDEATKIHVCSYASSLDDWQIKSTNDYNEIEQLFTSGKLIVGHSFFNYDIPLVEKILKIKPKYEDFIDTQAISWFCYPKRASHGLQSWGEDLGIAKPEIEDWDNLTYEEYRHRCEEDVKINIELWEKLSDYLINIYGELPIKFLKYISFKMHVTRLYRDNPFKLDKITTQSNLSALEAKIQAKKQVLKELMPKKEIKSKRVKPKVMYKTDGTMSVKGVKWKELCDERCVDFELAQELEIVVDYEEPNPESPKQIKDWLFGLGWKPCTFDIIKDDSGKIIRKVPQVYDDEKKLTPSVTKLGDMSALDELGILKHRRGILKGFLRDETEGYIYGRVSSFASTLRMNHAVLVNLPKVGEPYGDMIRGCLACNSDDYIFDSDLSSLENMVKLDIMYDINPEKVKEQLHPDFDPHLDIALLSGECTRDDIEKYTYKKKNKIEDEFMEKMGKIRQDSKQVNYSAQYGVGAETLARSLGSSKSHATKLIAAYWEANKEVKQESLTWRVKTANGKRWILNPYNEFWYELRTEKDRLSAVIQSTGDYITFCWTAFFLKKFPRLAWTYHDQLNGFCKESEKEYVKESLQWAIEKVNKMLNLKVPMKINTNFGKRFSEVH